VRHTWVCLLRGINVGGHNRVAMAELRHAYEAAGCRPVRTYIQSGNAVVGSDEEDAGNLRLVLRAALAERCGVDVPVLVRSAADWRDVVAANPFAGSDPADLHVSLLDASPPAGTAERLAAAASGGQRVALVDRQAYWCLPGGVTPARPLLTAADRALGPGTMRNWRTVLKLTDMVEEVDAPLS
jgi:uncharacterized protein (DUF1697 family)